MSSEKKQQHRDFWAGRGPSLIFIPTSEMVQYDMRDYRKRFECPRKMFDVEMERALAVRDWPTDGIPTIRPNLGTVYIPAIAGQDYKVCEGQMPWPGSPMTLEAIGAVRPEAVGSSEMLRRANEFYEIARQKLNGSVCAYLPDTQGIFDILHLMRGDSLFYELVDSTDKIKELLDVITLLYIEVSRQNKEAAGEPVFEMVHGHGTQQGLYFPGAGVRLSEDTPTLLSPGMIDEFVLPYMEKAARPFGGAFVHFCGKHEYLYERILRQEITRAIDLGNPEMFSTQWLLELCAVTDTVFYGKLASEPGEDWQTYLKRLAGLLKATGARCVLRPTVFPEERRHCEEMQQMWHELTA